MAQITSTGIEVDTFETLLARYETRLRALTGIPTLDVRDPAGWIANVALPLLEQIASIHELAAIIYNAPDPRRSTDQSYAIVAALRGVTRKEATVGKHVGVTSVFSALVSGSVLRGSIRFHPTGQPENVWINSHSVVITAPGSYAIACESEETGSSKTLIAAAAITILDGPVQLSSITVPTTATAGTNLETENVWRNRSDQAIRDEQTKLGAALEAIAGVVAARVVESPGFVRVIVDDNGGSVANNVIAAAILETKAEGVITTGILSGTAVDSEGVTVLVLFDRVTVLRAYSLITVKAPAGTSTSAVKAAMRAAQPKQSGDPLVWSKLNAAAALVVGVIDVTSLTIGFAAAPSGATNLLAAANARIDLALADITVTVTS